MDPRAPPSPTPSPTPSSDGLPGGFRQLLKHNAATSYPRDDEAITAMSRSQSRYGTPVPFYGPQIPPGYGPYDQSPSPQIHHAPYSYNTPVASPHAAAEYLGTRSGRNFRQTTNRIQKPAQRRRDRTKNNADLELSPGPLSLLAKDHPDAEVADIEAFVNRTAEVRHKELGDAKNKTPGKIKRPMNAFMLYRKAYQNLAKCVGTQNNHQIVSRVCGASWPQEPGAVREQFNDWAKTERTNHQNAHPDYKFTPSKPKPKDDESAHSEEAVDDGEWRPGRSRPAAVAKRTNGRSGNGNGGDVHGHAGIHPPGDRQASHMFGPGGAPYTTGMVHVGLGIHNPSTYQYSNPGRPMPAPYEHPDMYDGQYYHQQSVYPRQRMGYVEDVMIRKTPSPAMGHGDLDHQGFDPVGGYPSLPPSHGYAAYPGHHPHPNYPQESDYGVDPLLAGPESIPFGAHFPGMLVDEGLPIDPGMGLGDDFLLQDPQFSFLKGSEGEWQVETAETWAEEHPE